MAAIHTRLHRDTWTSDLGATLTVRTGVGEQVSGLEQTSFLTGRTAHGEFVVSLLAPSEAPAHVPRIPGQVKWKEVPWQHVQNLPNSGSWSSSRPWSRGKVWPE